MRHFILSLLSDEARKSTARSVHWLWMTFVRSLTSIEKQGWLPKHNLQRLMGVSLVIKHLIHLPQVRYKFVHNAMYLGLAASEFVAVNF